VEARDGEGDRFRGEAAEEVSVALVGAAAAVPEEEPLDGLAALEVVLEAEGEGGVVVVGQVDEDGRGLEDGEGRRLVVVDEDGNAAVGVEAQKPFFLLLAGADVAGEMGQIFSSGVQCRGEGGDWEWAYMIVVVNSVPYFSFSSSRRICTFWPLAVLWVMRWRPYTEVKLASCLSMARSQWREMWRRSLPSHS